ncbi:MULTISPECIES: DUF4225 domain-containing protein [unclassified Photorhabdus]|uniref:DUF4225 domain-containing protein n=2 Tax=Photorhabdus TaxID=29487 RepID=UPI000DCE4D27|nr:MULTISPECIES: DUF4225 domain-containing protein [unclassified Photorhabdus]RAW91432.1 hypothetical protein CKY05_24065 [Photorhabdus sp. S10-54]RAW91778.1 hypothetical protein CKY03_23865 [Photorhabdus sp. S9-53]RAW95070.1 hypothetical protein CKY04_24125 [Photorhabdus sp. S8-52]
MDALDEFYERNPSARGYLDNSTNEERKLLKIQMDKQNVLMMLMNRVSDKYVKWSLAKDHFIGEVMAYCQENTSKINTGEISISEAIALLDEEIRSLEEQDAMLSQKSVRQAIVVKKKVNSENAKSRNDETVNLIVSWIGFVSGSIQLIGGFLAIDSGVGATLGASLMAHGFNNVVESGYYILYRESYTGPVKFVYEGIGEKAFRMDKRDADVIYTSVDVGMSLNGLLGYKLEPDSQRLYRYIPVLIETA